MHFKFTRYRKQNCNTITNSFVVAIFIVTVSAIIIRTFYTVDLTDESYYVAEPYLVAKGMVPYITGWSQVPGSSLIPSFFVKLYLLFNKSTEGMVIYMRFVFLLFKAGVLYGVFCILKNCFDKYLVALYLLLLFAVIPHSLSGFSYNSLLCLQLAAATLLLFGSFMQANAFIKAQIMSFASGTISVLCVFSYPTMVILFIFYLFIIWLLEFCLFRKNRHKQLFCYICGGVTSSLILLAWLLIEGNGIGNLFHGLRIVSVDSAYWKVVKNHSFASILKSLFWDLKNLLPFFFSGCITYIFLIILNRHLQFIKIIKDLHGRQIAFLSGVVSLSCILIKSLFTPTSLYLYIGLCLFPFPVFFLFFIKTDRIKYITLLYLVWIPSIISIIIMSFGTGKLSSRYYILLLGSGLTAIYLNRSWKDTFPSQHYKAIHIFSALIVFTNILYLLIFNFYYYTYREQAMNSLTARVDYGIWSGLYTTPERKAAIEHVEKRIRQFTVKSDHVLFMDWSSFGYVMSESMPCAPSSVDVMLYTYDEQYQTANPDILYQYFKLVQCVPNKIIYVDYGRDQLLSIDKEGYPFNSFVNKYYNLIFMESDEPYPIKIYARKENCERNLRETLCK